MDFTVAICTYNGGNRLPRLFACLKSQLIPEHLFWEILVIDNNSTDNTAQIIAECQATWNLPIPFKYFFEIEQGAAFARKRAVQEAKAPLIGFLDDDNLPAPDWVASAILFGREHPLAGAYGSQVEGKFEGELPANFERIQPFLAITERGSEPKLYTPWKKVLPPGAGLVVRRKAWLASVPQHCILRGRTPESMLTGEDLEVVSYIQKAGWEIWYNPKMQIKHQIPAYRLQREYLISCFRGIGLSRHIIRMLNVQPWVRPVLFLAYLVNDLRKIIWHLLRYGAGVKTDVVAACELELFVNSLISPFFWGKHLLLGVEPRVRKSAR